tara:strand:- start:618 stop:878 length:261 start_codon:yes stop_codon:yes gene_type:complete
MNKILNILMILLIVLFVFFIYKYYSSTKNIVNRDFIRSNIDKILDEKVRNLPVLSNDTNNVIQFNDSFEEDIKDEKKRSFWDLIKK